MRSVDQSETRVFFLVSPCVAVSSLSPVIVSVATHSQLLLFRYEILEVIGKGSFGQVIRALDHKTGQHIAIKIIRYAETRTHRAMTHLEL